ncbi:MAG: tRNA epoxyqueuosine(34) reductase QueG, partial [Planctomycetota bacterium]
VLEGTRSVVMVADLYASRNDAEDPPVVAGRGGGWGRIARYARGRDYHSVIKKRLHRLADELIELHPGERFRAFTDTAPVLEREHAMRAGLGWIGKHTLLIHPELGSYTLLGGLLTTMRLEAPIDQRAEPDRCGSCTRCIDACPTDAITPYSVDARRCISYLTIERRAAIDERWFEGIGDWLVGCDICQEVCPHNSPRPPGHPSRHIEPNQAYEPRRDGFDALEVLGWDESARREAFTTSAMKRVTLDMMKRNALIVAGNRPTPQLRVRIEKIAEDPAESEMVRATARLVLDRQI